MDFQFLERHTYKNFSRQEIFAISARLSASLMYCRGTALTSALCWRRWIFSSIPLESWLSQQLSSHCHRYEVCYFIVQFCLDSVAFISRCPGTPPVANGCRCINKGSTSVYTCKNFCLYFITINTSFRGCSNTIEPNGLYHRNKIFEWVLNKTHEIIKSIK